MPAEHWPVLALLPVARLLVVGLVLVAALAWRRRYCSVPVRMAFTLLVLAMLAFAGLLASWGWLTAVV